MKLLSVNNKKMPITANIEIDVKHGTEIKREKVTVKSGESLLEKSKGISVYDGYIVNDIYCEKDKRIQITKDRLLRIIDNNNKPVLFTE